MNQLRVLHITPWYPTKEQPQKAIWIKRHIDSLEPYCRNSVLVLDIGKGKFRFTKHTDLNTTVITRRLPFCPWRLTEMISFFVLFVQLVLLKKSKDADIINFHIAYPAMVYYHYLRRVMPRKVVITEHWSAYHYHFHSTKPLNRIKKIFAQKVPLITVSKSLALDIERFSGISSNAYQVPNAVDVEVFKNLGDERKKILLLGSWWKAPKNPFEALDALTPFLNKNRDWSVRIFGGGPQEEAIKEWCMENGQNFLGMLTPGQISEELNQSFGFIMPTNYETFSVVTAEALCCGCPVLVSDVGGISELVNSQNGIALKDGDSWVNGLEGLVKTVWDREKIANEAKSKFNSDRVGKLYYKFLTQIAEC